MPRVPASFRFWPFAAALLLAFGLAACNLPATPPTPPITPVTPPEVTMPTLTAGVPLAVCDSAHMGPLTQTSPPNRGVVNTLTPELTWHYGDATTSCVPDHFELYLYTGPTFDEATAIHETLSATARGWTPPTALQPATAYAWSIHAVGSDGRVGASAGRAYFFTGPMCGAGTALAAPVLLAPANGAAFDYAADSFVWNYPHPCLPDGYRIEVSTAPDFSVDVGLNGGTGDPSTVWGLGHAPSPCQIYYWRVAAVRANGTVGPFSETRHFLVNPPAGGDCAPWGRIEGVVWHDLCAVPDGPLPDPPPEGCVVDADGSVHGDGIRQEDEPGIAGVKVNLYAGGCDGVLFDSVLTDSEGHYAFGVPEGTFCVQVDAGETPNDGILPPGRWTHPATTEGVATQSVTAALETSVTADFGWDFQFSPEPHAGTPPPHFVASQNAFCRQGPSRVYAAVATLTAGSDVPVEGRLADNSWLYVYWAPYKVYCWVAASLGESQGLETAPVVTPPPPPTPTPTPTPTSTPVPPTDTTPPTIRDVRALDSKVFYGPGLCGSAILHVTARVTDDGGISQDNITLVYRFVPKGGKPSAWHTAPVHEAAMGGQVGFEVPVNTKEVAGWMKQRDGYVEYYIKAVDNAGNGAESGMQTTILKYCK